MLDNASFPALYGMIPSALRPYDRIVDVSPDAS